MKFGLNLGTIQEGKFIVKDIHVDMEYSLEEAQGSWELTKKVIKEAPEAVSELIDKVPGIVNKIVSIADTAEDIKNIVIPQDSTKEEEKETNQIINDYHNALISGNQEHVIELITNNPWLQEIE